MKICLIYDCLFPYTVGGAERWYRNLGERLATEGHEVTYLTLRQWDRGERGGVPGVEVVAVGPRMSLYADSGRRRILPPLIFGAGVLWHLVRRGRGYDAVHTASFPYFSLLAAGLMRGPGRYRLMVDWHEVWTRGYWVDYLGRLGGPIGATVQKLCVRIPQRAFCFSQLHARRLRENGLRGELTVLEGEYAGDLEPSDSVAPEPVVVFAGRHIPEKRVSALVPALALARLNAPELRGLILGDGPERRNVLAAVEREGLREIIDVPGFVHPDVVDRALASALCLVLPSRREGYGLVVVEASARGTPSVVVAGEDNAATELIEEGVNGTVAPSASAEDLAAAIQRARRGGPELRRSTAEWFRENAERLSIESSLRTVAASYEGRPAVNR